MLSRLFVTQMSLGVAQTVVAAILALAVMALARQRSIHLERETVVALARGIVQIVAVGSVLVLLLQGPAWTSAFVLAAMMIAAAAISARRAEGLPGAFQVSLYGIGFGSGVVIVLMTLAGVIDPAITSLVPVGSMIVANAMNTNGLALNRFRADVEAHRGHVEAALALGAAPEQAAAPHVQDAVAASLIPRIDSLRSLGIVWIPGLMTGMILSGTDPIYAAIYQFVIIAMIYAAGGLTSVVSTLLIRERAFSPAEQLILRPG
jgi:putative ABC transport system permease protein